MKKVNKILSVLLSVVLIMQVVSIGITPSAAKSNKNRAPEIEAYLKAEQVEAAAVSALDEAAAAGSFGREASPILGEAAELRDESTKVYRHQDGTYTAAVYGGPVHFRDGSGTWQDINNALSLDESKRSAADKATYTPAASGLDIRIPQDFAGGQMITVGKDGYTVGLGVNARYDVQPEAEIPAAEEEPFVPEEPTNELEEEEAPAGEEESLAPEEASNASAEAETNEAQPEADDSDGLDTSLTSEPDDETIAEPAALQPQPVGLSAVKAEVNNDLAVRKAPGQPEADTVEAANAEKMKLDSLSSAVIYRGIFPGADLEYIVTPSRIKEYITVREAQEEYEYLFDLSLGGLIPVPQEDGSICLFKGAGEAEPLFILEAPYMYDAAGEESYALTMALAEDGTLTLTADAAWINDESRVLPVVIDPTLIISRSYNSGFRNYYINSLVTGTNYHSADFLVVGKDLFALYRSYIKFPLPSLPDGSVVTNANMKVTQCSYDASPGNYLYMFETPFDALDYSCTWSNQPFSQTPNGPLNGGARLLDYAEIQGIGSKYNFDLTKAVRNWYENETNEGVMFCTSNETKNAQARLASSRNLDYSGPLATIQYTNPIGLEDYWQYECVDLGRSGMAYVNDFNGALTYAHSDLNMSGLRMPLSISHVYNSNTEGALDSKVSFSVGSKFHLNLEELVVPVTDPGLIANGYRYALYDADGTKHYFIEETVDNAPVIVQEYDSTVVLTQSGVWYVISDSQGNKKYYNSSGLLFKLEDRNGNEQNIAWNSGKIAQVTDGAGRTATFGYSGNLLASITDPAGRATSYAYNGVGQLATITYPDAKTTTFLYQNNNLSKITADDNSALEFQFTAVAYNSGSRLSLMTQLDKAGAQFNHLQFSYTNTNVSGMATGNTLVTDALGNSSTYLFDTAGRATSVTNQHGQTHYQMYHTLPADPSMAQRNVYQRLQSTSELQTIAANLLKNNGFEDGNASWQLWPAQTATAGYSDDCSRRGQYSMCM
ncbi:MAG: DNRLRE domain-containing protein, partial [Defluviitaleaceae bacterium]|nr:DNRLRE domain-containing protein [Defluviitaleaceae bacterium]